MSESQNVRSSIDDASSAMTRAMDDQLSVGMVGRFFPANYRSPAQEIAFAAAVGFRVIQFRNDRPGKIEEELRCSTDEVGAALGAAGVEAALEMLLRIDDEGRTAEGDSIVEAFEKNLDAVIALGCRWVHLHLVPATQGDGNIGDLEERMVEALARTCARAEGGHFRLGFEHNSPEERLFASPEACARVLKAIPQLSFVWDINHTVPDELVAFKRLLPRASLIHASDTPLPETNHHLPIGLGTIDFDDRLAALAEAKFDGPIVLEIGGLPRSGGYGKDTDEALCDSRNRLLGAAAKLSV